MTVTWTGELSVNGGAWQPVSDVGNTVSQPLNVTILEAHAVLTTPTTDPAGRHRIIRRTQPLESGPGRPLI